MKCNVDGCEGEKHQMIAVELEVGFSTHQRLICTDCAAMLRVLPGETLPSVEEIKNLLSPVNRELYKHVYEAMQNAKANGYFGSLERPTALEVAEDMNLYCSGTEHYSIKAIEQQIQNYWWRENKI